jgi:hypothetical protein
VAPITAGPPVALLSLAGTINGTVHMRIAAIAFLAALGFAACGTDGSVTTYHNAVTGAACSPDMSSYVPPKTKGAKHAGCDANRCCIVIDGECDDHPDAGIIPNPL